MDGLIDCGNASYFNDMIRPRVIVGKGQDLRDEPSKGGFLLSHPIQQRAMTNFFRHWPMEIANRPYDVDDLINFMEMTGSDLSQSLIALESCKFNFSDSVLFLTEISDEELYELNSSALKTHPMKLFDSKEDIDFESNPVVRNLAAEFSVSIEIAALALQLEGDEEGASLLLSDSDQVAQLAEVIRNKAAIDPESKEDPALRIVADSIISSHNPLVKLCLYVEHTVTRINETCISCETPLKYVGMKPSICGDDVCILRYEELGVGFSLEDEVIFRPIETDLLISFCSTAASESRLHLFFPQNVRDKANTDTFSNDTAYSEVADVIDLCPSVQDMQQFAANGILREKLKSLHVLLYPLLQWIITSNRSHIRLLRQEERIPQVSAKYQFILLSSAPAKEARFHALKEAAKIRQGNGSFFAYHGSQCGNWHTIVRTGLKNMSNTKNMLNGAAYGSGIYMAPDSNTATNYARKRSQSTSPWCRKSIFGAGWTCYAICEVANLSTITEPKPYYVVPEEDAVITRFLAVMVDGQVQPRLTGDSITIPEVAHRAHVKTAL